MWEIRKDSTMEEVRGGKGLWKRMIKDTGGKCREDLEQIIKRKYDNEEGKGE